MTIRIETGPHSKAPYPNWKFWEISPEALEDQGLFAQEMADLKEFLNDIDTGVDPHGSFSDQVEKAVIDLWETNRNLNLKKRLTNLSLAGAGEQDEHGYRVGDEPWDFEVYVKELGDE